MKGVIEVRGAGRGSSTHGEGRWPPSGRGCSTPGSRATGPGTWCAATRSRRAGRCATPPGGRGCGPRTPGRAHARRARHRPARGRLAGAVPAGGLRPEGRGRAGLARAAPRAGATARTPGRRGARGLPPRRRRGALRPAAHRRLRPPVTGGKRPRFAWEDGPSDGPAPKEGPGSRPASALAAPPAGPLGEIGADAPFGIVVADDDLLCTAANASFASLVGADAGEAVGRSLADLLPGASPALFEAARGVLADGRPRFRIPVVLEVSGQARRADFTLYRTDGVGRRPAPGGRAGARPRHPAEGRRGRAVGPAAPRGGGRAAGPAPGGHGGALGGGDRGGGRAGHPGRRPSRARRQRREPLLPGGGDPRGLPLGRLDGLERGGGTPPAPPGAARGGLPPGGAGLDRLLGRAARPVPGARPGRRHRRRRLLGRAAAPGSRAARRRARESASPAPTGSTRRSEGFLEALAHQCAQAVDRARLYETQRELRAQAEEAAETRDLLVRELRRTLRERDESTALLDALFVNAPVGLALLDRDMRYVRMNACLAAMHEAPGPEPARPDALGGAAPRRARRPDPRLPAGRGRASPARRAHRDRASPGPGRAAADLRHHLVPGAAWPAGSSASGRSCRRSPSSGVAERVPAARAGRGRPRPAQPAHGHHRVRRAPPGGRARRAGRPIGGADPAGLRAHRRHHPGARRLHAGPGRAGRLPAAPARLDLAALARSVAEECEAAHAGREVRVTAPEPVHGEWDGDRVGQAVANLVNNALQYGPEGTPVEVACWAEAEEAWSRSQRRRAHPRRARAPPLRALPARRRRAQPAATGARPRALHRRADRGRARRRDPGAVRRGPRDDLHGAAAACRSTVRVAERPERPHGGQPAPGAPARFFQRFPPAAVQVGEDVGERELQEGAGARGQRDGREPLRRGPPGRGPGRSPAPSGTMSAKLAFMSSAWRRP